MTIKFTYSFNSTIHKKSFDTQEKAQKWFEKQWAEIHVIDIR
jgi:hypothetical protein